MKPRNSNNNNSIQLITPNRQGHHKIAEDEVTGFVLIDLLSQRKGKAGNRDYIVEDDLDGF